VGLLQVSSASAFFLKWARSPVLLRTGKGTGKWKETYRGMLTLRAADNILLALPVENVARGNKHCITETSQVRDPSKTTKRNRKRAAHRRRPKLHLHRTFNFEHCENKPSPSALEPPPIRLLSRPAASPSATLVVSPA
jgi:hypothetical protein